MESNTSADVAIQLITTNLNWTDLVLNEQTLSDINDINTWLKHTHTFQKNWQLKGKIKPGYRVLFCGPSGTGKTLSAGLIGNLAKKEVYKIDLSMIISKYIGETEKNLSHLFDRAENKDWILFFDEADSLFGKRTQVKEAYDRYANQEISYLLQRIENYKGLVILATNYKGSIDSSITRRFNSIVKFKKPGVTERIKLWESYIPSGAEDEDQIMIQKIAKKYELTGANIVNVIQYAALNAAEKNVPKIEFESILKGIQKEYVKEGKRFRKKKK